jgi:membrane protein DedA with SNARE-associated domain
VVHQIIELTSEYGLYIYALMFLWAFFEGETFVIFSGVAASLGYLDLWAIFFAAWFGSFAGDQLYFWIGRKWGVQLLHKMPRWRMGVDMALDWLRRYNTWFILSFRFIYGVRNFASFAMGLSQLSPVRFAALNFIAASVWAMIFASVGFGVGHLFGDEIETLLQHAVEIFGLTMLAIFVIACFLIGIVIHARRRPPVIPPTLPLPSKSD